MGKKIDLIQCPHCGSEKLRIDDNGFDDIPGGDKPNSYWVVCLQCYACGGPGGNQKEAAENWNKRITE